MEWSDLRIFLGVARKGSLNAASRSLRLSQPTVGRRLAALEASLQRTLFQRTPGGMVLTEVGVELLARVEAMELQALSIEQTVASGTDREGTLKIGCSEWFGARLLPGVFAEFTAAHPRVSLEVLTDYRLLSLTRRRLDVSFRIVPFDEPDVVARRLLTMPYCVYTATSAPDPGPEGEGVRLVTLSTNLLHLPDAAWLRDKLPRARVALRSNNREVQASVCALGVGVAVLPRPLADGLPGLRLLDLGEAPPSQDTWIGYHRDQGAAPAVRAFVDLAVRRLAEPASPGTLPRP